MREFGLRYGVVVLLLATTACVQMRVQMGADPEPEATPTLIGCSGYVPSTVHWTEPNRVSIRMKVQSDGSVEPGSLQHDPSRFDRGGEAAVSKALSMARACSFEPAHDDEEPVSAWTSIRFAFS